MNEDLNLLLRDLERERARSSDLERALAEKTHALEAESLQIKRADGYLAHILETISMSVIVINEDLTINSANSATRRIFGLRPSALPGKRIDEVLPIEPLQVRSCVALNGIEREFMYERPSDRHTIPIVIACSGMFDDAANCIGTVCTFTDVSSRKNAEQQILLTQKMESIGRLAAGVAHEINTPMQYIRDNLFFVRDELAQAMPRLAECLSTSADIQTAEDCGAELCALFSEFSPALNDAISGAETVAHIVRSLKEFSHPGTEQKVLVDLHAALESTIIITRSEWRDIAVLSTDLVNEPCMVPGYAAELNQVFLNLIVNAAQAIGEASGRPRGAIDISMKHVTGGVEITVSDNGPGISEEIQSKIFEPFFTTKPQGVGSGQGLTFAYRTIVDRHHGKLSVSSTPGRGTAFTIFLPNR